MQGTDRLQELTVFFQKNSGKILTGRCNLALTTHTLAHLNRHFRRSEENGVDDSGTHSQYQDRRQAQTVMFLLSYVRKMPALKLIHPSSTLHGPGDISRFRGLTMLEIKKVPLHMLNGLGCLRHQLQVLICSRCVQSLQNLLCSCGGDMLSEAPWSSLHTLNLSYNHIDALDDSLRLLPVLKMLDLSHNDLRHTRDYLECLSELAHLNLGYNRLERVPTLGLVARTNLQTLVLRNNSLDNLSGLEDYSSLLELDLGNNCVYEGVELRTLGYLHNLREVNLLGNPLAFDPEYRSIVVSKFPPEGASRKMYLDGVPLSHTENQLIPKASLTRPLVRAPSQTSVDTVGSIFFNEASSFEESSDFERGKRTRGKRAPKVRQVSIPDQGTHKVKVKSRAMFPDTSVKDTKLEVEKMRQLHGQDWLLALQAPYTSDSASDTEKTGRRPSEPKVAQSKSRDRGSSGIESDIDSTTRADQKVAGRDEKEIDKDIDLKIDKIVENVIEKTAAPVGATSQPVNEQESSSMHSDVLLEKKDSKPSIFLERAMSDSDTANDSPWTELAPEDEEHELCSPLLVTRQDPGLDGPVHLFLTVKQTYLEERDLNGHMTEKLEIKSLRSMQHTTESVWSEEAGVHIITPVIHLTFDYIRRDRKKREYALEDEESVEILSKTLQPFLDENRLAASSHQATFQCLKCSLEFALHQAKRRLATRPRSGTRGGYNSEDENTSDIESWMNEVPVCPACSSDLIVELESPMSPSNHASAVSTPMGSLNSVEMNIKPMATSSPWKLKEKDSVYLSSTERSKSGSSTEYHSASNSLSTSPAQGSILRPAISSSSSGTSTLVNSAVALSPTGRQRHITEESIDEKTCEVLDSTHQPQEGKSIDGNFVLPDPTIRMSRGDETNPLENISTYQHEKLLELLQENIAPFSQKYSLVPPDILDGVSSREASGAATPRTGVPMDQLSQNAKNSTRHTNEANNVNRAEDISRRTKSKSSTSATQKADNSMESSDRLPNGHSRPCSEDDIVILPTEQSNSERLDVSFKGVIDAPQDAFSYDPPSAGVGRAGSTDSEIAVLRNNSIDTISITSDSVFDSSLNAGQTNLANALSDAATRLEIIHSTGTSITEAELENSGVYSNSSNARRTGDSSDQDEADSRTSSGQHQTSSQSSNGKESSMTTSFEASISVSTPDKPSMIDARDGDFCNVDHRLKLYFSMSLFGSDEDLACMTKGQIFQFSKSVNFAGLLVISTRNIYILKINKEESEKPSDFLAKRSQHSVRDLHLIHIGPGSQGFQLDFTNEGILYTIVMRDAEMCQAFVAQFDKAVQQAPVDKKRRFKGVIQDHPNTTMNLMCQVFGESMDEGASQERDTEVNLYMLVHRKTTKEIKRGMLLRDWKQTANIAKTVATNLLPVSILVTPADLYLAEENHFWPLRQTKAKGQAKTSQFTLIDHHSITDISEVEMYEDTPLDISLVFFHEDTTEHSHWHIQTENASCKKLLLDAIKTPWKEMFGVDIKETIQPSVLIEMDDSVD